MLYRRFAGVMALVLLLGTALSPAAALAAVDSAVAPASEVGQLQPTVPTVDRMSKEKARVIGETDPGSTEKTRYIVQLAGAPVALYQGGITGFAPTSPTIVGRNQLQIESADVQAYQDFLASEQAAALQAIESSVGRSVNSIFSYRLAYNGFTLELTPQEAAEVAKLDGVKSVHRDFVRYLQTDAGPDWIGAPGIWSGDNTPSNIDTQGEGVVVGIIDSGINMDHPSFADVGDDGYDHTNPRGRFYGVCDPTSDVFDASFTCNDKLIGAWDFYDVTSDGEADGPEDSDGHGSHTASTAAGNVVNMARDFPTITYEATISGVAPHANLISYDVCGPENEGCAGSAILASIDQAVADEVDVINYSIGSATPSDPWGSPDSVAFLAATEAGVVVVTSAGNNGPGFATVGSPNNAPWMFAVGASTHDRKLVNAIVNMSGGDTAPPADIAGKSLTSDYGPAPIVYAGDFGDALCLDPFPADTFNGEIVVCDRGVIARVGKGENVLAGGAGGYILANDEASGDSLNGDPHVLPAVHISYDDGVVLKEWLASGDNHLGAISGTVADFNAANGDIMASFSSRGPNNPVDVIKPDITGPGVDILAAYKDPEDYDFLSGTSMSSPHVAGAAALMTALYPDWSHSQIKSALMTTALTDGVLKEDSFTPTDPFDDGAGRIDLTQAAAAGFVLDIAGQEYLDADPNLGGEPAALNLASLGSGGCIGECTWTRTLQSTLDTDVNWTVTTAANGLNLVVDPASFTLPARGTQTVTITADVTGAALDEWNFGQIIFTPDNGEIAEAHFPVATYAATAVVDDITIETRRNQGQVTVSAESVALENPAVTIYSSDPVVKELELAQDPTNGDPYDLENGGVVWELVDIVETTKLFSVFTSDSTAPDLDLYVGIDANANSEPDPEEELCFSASASADEFCQLSAPLDAGTYWVLVQNWEGSGEDTDSFLLSISVTDQADTGAITATAPASVEGGVPYGLDIAWNIPNLMAGDVRFGLLELADAEGNTLASASVELVRLADDVTLSASDEVVEPGDTLTYSINVQPETATGADSMVYNFAATLPEGLSYVDGSAAIPPTSIDGNTIRWDGIPVSTLRQFVQTNSNADAFCDTRLGGYVNLEDFGITPQPGLEGDGIGATFTLDTTFDFYGTEYDAVVITDDGFLTVLSEVGENPNVNTDLPNPVLPNGLMAPMWRDLVVVYDGPLNRGISLASSGEDVYIIEFDDVEPSPVGSTGDRFDFEVVLWTALDDSPGSPEIIFAYDNLSGDVSQATIGLENADGTEATKYAFNDAELEDGFMICYDWTVPSITATFDALVGDSFNGPTMVTTTLEHTVVAEGYGSDTAEVDTDVQAPTAIDDDDPDFVPGEDSRIFLPVIVR